MGDHLRRCGTCLLELYCSGSCQRAGWRDGHREVCVKLRRAAVSALRQRKELIASILGKLGPLGEAAQLPKVGRVVVSKVFTEWEGAEAREHG